MGSFGTKICPQCGQELFIDMAVCYGCLYSFESRAPDGSNPLLSLPDIDGEEGGMPTAAEDTPSMMLRISTDDAQTTIPVPASGLTIGRDVLCDVVLKSRAVSKRHVRIVPLSSAVIVEDLGSTNPACYKGRDIGEAAVVHVGEDFDICGATFTVVA